jgi:hypothetical protein
MARGARPETVREWADGTDGRCAIKSPRGRTGKAVARPRGWRACPDRYVARANGPQLRIVVGPQTIELTVILMVDSQPRRDPSFREFVDAAAKGDRQELSGGGRRSAHRIPPDRGTAPFPDLNAPGDRIRAWYPLAFPRFPGWWQTTIPASHATSSALPGLGSGPKRTTPMKSRVSCR